MVFFAGLFHHDFSDCVTHFCEIQAFRQFDGRFAVDFLCEDGLAKGVGNGQTACTFYSESALGRVWIDIKSIIVFVNPGWIQQWIGNFIG